MDNNNRLLAVAQADDVEDLLSHIAWTDVIKPKLEALKAQYASILVQQTLGVPSTGLTREQLAGQIYGIDFISRLMETILQKGAKALDELKYLKGVSITSE